MRTAHLMVYYERTSQDHMNELRRLHWSQAVKTSRESRERGSIHHCDVVKKLSAAQPNNHQEEALEMDQSHNPADHEAHTGHFHSQELNYAERLPESSTPILLLQTIMPCLHPEDVLNEEQICQESTHSHDQEENPLPLFLENHCWKHQEKSVSV